MQKISYSILCLIAILLSACGGGTTSRSISGSVSGPTSAAVLQNNGGDNLTVSAAGTFSFGTPVADGNTYDITVLTQPAGQTCAVSKGTGIVSGDDITDVAVTCTRKAYSVGGTISGLTGNLVLQNNSADSLALTADGIFNFATHLKDDNPYNVTVLTQPAGQHCGVTNSSGTIVAASVTNVIVTCTADTSNEIVYETLGLAGGFVMPSTGLEPTYFVIRNALDWAAAWSKQVSFFIPPQPLPPPPTVDFSSRMIIGIAKMGSSGCDGLGIAKIFNLSGELVVEYRFGAPSRSDWACTAVITNNAHFVTVPQSQLPVRFVGIAN